LIVVRLWILEQVSFLFGAVCLLIRWDSEPAARYHEDTKTRRSRRMSTTEERRTPRRSHAEITEIAEHALRAQFDAAGRRSRRRARVARGSEYKPVVNPSGLHSDSLAPAPPLRGAASNTLCVLLSPAVEIQTSVRHSVISALLVVIGARVQGRRRSAALGFQRVVELTLGSAFL